MTDKLPEPFHIAVLAPDRLHADLLCDCIEALGHASEVVASATRLARSLQRETCHLLVASLDADLQEIRANLRRHPSLPVMWIASPGQSAALASLLAQHGGDYLLAPLRRPEVLTRLRVCLARAYPDRFAARHESFGPYRFERESGQLLAGKQTLELTQKEFELALLLFRHLGQPLSRATIEEAVWHRNIALDDVLPSRTVDTHISRIRTKLNLVPEQGYRLAPVYGYGYCLEQIDG